MSSPSTNAPRWGQQGPDPGPGIRVLVALLLRLAIGLSLLNSGLAGYLNVNLPGTGPNLAIPNVTFNGLDPLIAAIPYLSLGLGLALILGFLMTPSAVAAGFFSLLHPLMLTVMIISSGMAGGGMGGGWANRFGGDPFQYMLMTMGMSGFLPTLIPYIALIWLSPLENHPYSVDALIFGRHAPRIVPPSVPVEVTAGPLEGSVEPDNAAEPGRVAEPEFQISE